ncbi:MAG: transposase mutator type [Frankiales bacterium]|nr:transposase mutator type [Frankiales bacterium]
MTTVTRKRTPAASSADDGGGGPGPAKVSGRQLRELLADDMWLDELIDRSSEGGVSLTGEGGFLPELIKAVLERGLAAELTEHLGYEAGDPAGRGSPNSRNGHTPKTVQSQIGPLGLDVPRDRNSSFEPRLVPKGERRLHGLDDMIISLYAGGMTVRDIQHHLARTLGTELSHDTISRITDAVLDEVKAWQNRPLEAIYPIVYIDALMVKVRDGQHVRNKAAHLVIGVDTDGIKHVLGIWVAATEGATFWAGVCAELANRGVQDILIACCDGLTGLPEAIEATFPHTTVQTCVVHLIRRSMRFVGYGDRKKVAAALRPIYTASNADAAETALLEFAESELGRKHPTAVAVWQNAWDRFTPFLAFPPEVRKIIYTTNAIESLNYQLRKIIKNRGHFPNDDAVIKLLWLAIRDIEDKRARARTKEKGLPRDQRKASGKLIEGAVTQGWKPAMAALLITYPDRITPHL